MYDIYRNNKEPSERMAVLSGTGLPGHVNPKEWELMPPLTSQITEGAVHDVKTRGFSYYKLV
jgi:hypothetical protein